MFAKLKTAFQLAAQAVAHPSAALYALRERGLGHVLRHVWRSDPGSLQMLARDVRFRSQPATRENLQAYYSDVAFETSDDDEHYKVRLPTGELFYIRVARGWHDLGTLYDTFVNAIYADHPPVDGKTVLDIGANIGDTAVYFGKRGAHVTAYEPDPQMCDLARRNARLNGVYADFRNAGVGSKDEMLLLSSSPSGADSMSVTLFPGSAPVNKLHVAALPVRIVAFANAIAAFEMIDLVKFDCEGCECPALLSLPEDALRKIQHVIMEYHSHGDALAQRLRDAGFSVRLHGAMYMRADRTTANEGAAPPRPE
jgi:FkbM family methyltransferase